MKSDLVKLPSALPTNELAFLFGLRNFISSILPSSQVFIDEMFCGTVHYINVQRFYRIECGRVMATAIKIVSEQNDISALTLCEVEVFSLDPPGLFPNF